MSDAPDTLSLLCQLASRLQRRADVETAWKDVDDTLRQVFGHRLFTALVFNRPLGRLARIYSNRPDINPVGGAKAVTQSFWTQRVLLDGAIHVGSTRADIQSVFSEYETLWSIGCESVLNIPVRQHGETVGTLNLLDAEHRYDQADHGVALLVAQMLTELVVAQRAALRFDALDAGQLEHV